ncbi:TerC family protein [Thermonema rossianum]|uniref:TerC family protein n=1 Tax=Thermonema rossianum TaxID=55505 RepID=UPI000690EF1E|nr:TerC family protein [Thermonema rossianum]
MEILNHLLTTESLISLVTLTFMEIVLGIDNIIFISIIASKLPDHQQKKGTNWGLVIALIPRVILLLALSWMIGLNQGLLQIGSYELSGRDLILLAGGLFLIYKATTEIHQKLEGDEEVVRKGEESGDAAFFKVIAQVALINVVFSFDSILTAIGLVDADKPENLWIMIIAVVLSMLVMMLFAYPIARFVEEHPTIKMLALAFLLMIGTLLTVEALHYEVPKGYIYFSIAFSLFVELLNLRLIKRSQKPVHLHQRYVASQDDQSAPRKHEPVHSLMPEEENKK